MIKGPIQEDIITINVYAPNIRATKHMKKTLPELKGERDSNTKIIRDFKEGSMEELTFELRLKIPKKIL